MPSSPAKIGNSEIMESKLLLVEGKDDLDLLQKMLSILRLEGIQIISYDGKHRLHRALAAYSKARNFEKVVAIGITRDADESLSDAMRSIQGALERSKLPSPSGFGSWATGSPRTSAYIFPDNKSSGELEDLCLQALAGSPALTCSDAIFSCLKSASLPVPKKLAKARIMAFLATQESERAGPRLGNAAQQGVWQLDTSPTFAELRDWLKSF